MKPALAALLTGLAASSPLRAQLTTTTTTTQINTSLTKLAPMNVSSVALSASHGTSTQPFTGTVVLSSAPLSDITVQLSTSPATAMLSVMTYGTSSSGFSGTTTTPTWSTPAASVALPIKAGQTSATFGIRTPSVSAAVPVKITATAASSSSAVFTVDPVAVASFTIDTHDVSFDPTASNQVITVSVGLTQGAPAAGFTLHPITDTTQVDRGWITSAGWHATTSRGPLIHLPTTVTIPSGIVLGKFQASVDRASSLQLIDTVSMPSNRSCWQACDVAMKVGFLETPLQQTVVLHYRQVMKFDCFNTITYSSRTPTCTLTLSAAAPASGWHVRYYTSFLCGMKEQPDGSSMYWPLECRAPSCEDFAGSSSSPLRLADIGAAASDVVWAPGQTSAAYTFPTIPKATADSIFGGQMSGYTGAWSVGQAPCSWQTRPPFYKTLNSYWYAASVTVSP